MNNEQLCTLAREKDFRIAQCVIIAAEVPEALTDACEEMLEDHRDEVVEAIPDVHADFKDESMGELDGDFIYWLQCKGKMGFLLLVETPVIEYDSETSYSSSWCSWTQHIAYGETIEKAIDNAVAQVDKYQAEQLRRYKKAASK